MILSSIRSIEALAALKPDWDDLWQRSPGASHYQSADYALQSWRGLAEPAGYELFCVTGREDGRLVLVWPLKIRRRLLWRICRPLFANIGEQTDFLAEDGPDADRRTGAALDFVLRKAGADILDLQFVPANAALGTRLRSRPTRGTSRPFFVPHVQWEQEESFEDYLARLGKATRKTHEKKHRRLKKLGTLHFERVADARTASAVIGSLLAFKRAWAEKVPDANFWIHDPIIERFLVSMPMAGEDERTGMALFALRLDDVLLAAQIVALGHHVDWLTAGYNPDYQQHSPGMVMNEYCLRWAHERGLSVLMGAGQEANKEFWCGRQGVASDSRRMPASLLGAATFEALRLRDVLRPGRRREAASRDAAAERPAPAAYASASPERVD